MKPATLSAFFLVLILILNTSIYAQTPENRTAESNSREHFFASPILETNYYGVEKPAIGIGLALGYGDGTAVGLRILYVQSLEENKITSLELTSFFRTSIPKFDADNGLFLQLNAGIAIFSGDSALSFPEEGGGFSFGAAAGWRFLFGERYFVEPYIRAGYPYYGGIGVAAGVRF